MDVETIFECFLQLRDVGHVGQQLERVLADVDTAFSAAKTDPAPEAAALAADRVFAEATR